MIKMELSEKKIKKHNITRTIHLSLLVSLKYFSLSQHIFFFFTPECRFPEEKTRDFFVERYIWRKGPKGGKKRVVSGKLDVLSMKTLM